jgi:glycosyltransferase involved in cell wall biosynthesis
VGISVIIPSKTASNLIPCVEAVRTHEPGARIIVVDDGVDWASASPRVEPIFQVVGERPFVYARNCNLGIKAAGDDDVVLLNDDALLQTVGGFSVLQKAAEEHPEYGVIAAACSNVGNRNQRPQGHYRLHDDPRMVCFVCVLIPRRTLDMVGLLDERFTGYGHEDDDYCYRVRRAGLKIGIHDGCYCDHGKLRSTFRGAPGAGGDLRVGRQIFIDKWGSYPL